MTICNDCGMDMDDPEHDPFNEDHDDLSEDYEGDELTDDDVDFDDPPIHEV